jgi:hypothetical protein
MLGNWCWIEGGDEQNWNQQIFARVPPEGCHGGDSLIRIDQNGIEGEGSCTFGKIEQTGPNDFLIYRAPRKIAPAADLCESRS